MLLKAGADVNAANDYFIPLIYAVSENQIEIVSVLLHYGADLKITDQFGNDSLQVAAERGYTEIIKMILKEGADPNAAQYSKSNVWPLIQAVCNGHVESVAILIEAGANVNVVDIEG